MLRLFQTLICILVKTDEFSISASSNPSSRERFSTPAWPSSARSRRGAFERRRDVSILNDSRLKILVGGQSRRRNRGR